jgi:hypothetical protein
MRTCTRAGAESAKDTVCLVKSGLTVKRENEADPSNGSSGAAVAVGAPATVAVAPAVEATVGLSGTVAVVVAVEVTAGAVPTVEVAVAVSLGVLLGGSGVDEDEAVGDGGAAVAVGVSVGGRVGLLVWLAVGVADGTSVGRAVSVAVGVALGLGDGRGVAVSTTVGDRRASCVGVAAVWPGVMVAVADGDGGDAAPPASEWRACRL